jgi:hypothetical protein
MRPPVKTLEELADVHRNAKPAAPESDVSFGGRPHDGLAMRTGTRDKSFEQDEVPFVTDRFAPIDENPFRRVADAPLSTFSIDVDTASYSQLRRGLTDGNMPPKSAVRIEEMINYFDYRYPAPTDGKPLGATMEISSCPWNTAHRLVRIGVQAKRIESANVPPRNLVFLLDVSGSMNRPDKLELVKDSLRFLVEDLRDEDRIAIVVYAGASGLVLPTTPRPRSKLCLEKRTTRCRKCARSPKHWTTLAPESHRPRCSSARMTRSRRFAKPRSARTNRQRRRSRPRSNRSVGPRRKAAS